MIIVNFGSCLACLVAICALAPRPAAVEYRAGDEVVSIADALVLVGEEAVDEVHPGSILTIQRIDGQKLQVSTKPPGWLHQRHVVLLDRAAIDRFTALLRIEPSARMFAGRAFTWLALGGVDAAADDFNQAIARDNSRARYYVGRGVAFGLQGNHGAAIAEYTAALRLDPNYGLAYFQRAMARAKFGDLEDVIADYTEALRIDPRDAAAYNNRGVTWLHRGRHYLAVRDFNEALRIDPEQAASYAGLGGAKFGMGRYDEAVAYFDEAIRRDPRAAANYCGRGSVWHVLGNHDRALSDYRESLRLGASDQYPAIYGCLAAMQLGNLDEADHMLEAASSEASKMWPDPAVRFLRRQLNAKKLLAAAVDDDQRTEAHYYIGVVHLASDRTSLARSQFEWVRDHGSKRLVEYDLAVAELRRLDAAQ